MIPSTPHAELAYRRGGRKTAVVGLAACVLGFFVEGFGLASSGLYIVIGALGGSAVFDWQEIRKLQRPEVGGSSR